MYDRDGMRLAPLYDVVSTAVYPDLSTELALSVGDELDPDAITAVHWSNLAGDFGLSARGFERVRRELSAKVAAEAVRLQDDAHVQGWNHPCLETILEVIGTRRARVG